MSFRLETARTFMREILGNDFEFLLGMLSNPEVMRFYPRCYSARDVREFIDRMRARYREDGCGLWLVVHRESGQPLGRVGLIRQLLNGQDEFEVGYMIDRPFWRRGLASETAAAVRDYAFRERGLARVISLIRPENLPSQGVARKLGMEVTGRAEHGGLEHLVFSIEAAAAQSA
jgi:RimJ/RimL family protein N-acetyltransferase